MKKVVLPFLVVFLFFCLPMGVTNLHSVDKVNLKPQTIKFIKSKIQTKRNVQQYFGTWNGFDVELDANSSKLVISMELSDGTSNLFAVTGFGGYGIAVYSSSTDSFTLTNYEVDYDLYIGGAGSPTPGTVYVSTTMTH